MIGIPIARACLALRGGHIDQNSTEQTSPESYHDTARASIDSQQERRGAPIPQKCGKAFPAYVRAKAGPLALPQIPDRPTLKLLTWPFVFLSLQTKGISLPAPSSFSRNVRKDFEALGELFPRRFLTKNRCAQAARHCDGWQYLPVSMRRREEEGAQGPMRRGANRKTGLST